MAKKIQISPDGGTTYNDLPGSTGSFSSDREGIEDTIFGQTFNSQEVGLITWGVSSDGIFKGFAGYLAEIKKSGTSTALTDEAMTLVSGKTYSIDDAAKEIWDLNGAAAITFDDAAVLIDAADIESIDYLFGQVTFVSSFTPGGAVTVAGFYFPTASIGKSNAYTLTMTADAVDNSDFDTVQANSNYKTHEAGLRGVALELNGVFDATEDAQGDLEAGAQLVIDVDPAGDGSSIARGFFKISNTNQGGAVGALEDETTQFTLTVPEDDKLLSVFNWRHTSTTLAVAIQNALTSWLTELNTYDVRYLPQGSITQSPLDGHEGNFVVTDISLSGGLSNMNVFTMELMGTGAVSPV